MRSRAKGLYQEKAEWVKAVEEVVKGQKDENTRYKVGIHQDLRIYFTVFFGWRNTKSGRNDFKYEPRPDLSDLTC